LRRASVEPEPTPKDLLLPLGQLAKHSIDSVAE
jgi:hypothetical protein